MSERTLPKPLSGDEIIEIIKNQVEAAMRRDCYLAGHLAYSSFRVHGHLEIVVYVSGPTDTKTTSVAVDLKQGEAEPESEVVEGDTEVSYDAGDKPNEARRENDLGVPVLATDAAGHVTEKKIKYRGKG